MRTKDFLIQVIFFNILLLSYRGLFGFEEMVLLGFVMVLATMQAAKMERDRKAKAKEETK